MNRIIIPLAVFILIIYIPFSGSVVLADSTVTWDLTADSHGGTPWAAGGTASYGFGSFVGGVGLQSSTSPAGYTGTYYFAAADWAPPECISSVRFVSTAYINDALGNVAFFIDGGSSFGNTYTTGTDGGGYYYQWALWDVTTATSIGFYSAVSGTSYAITSITFTINSECSGGGGALGTLTRPLITADEVSEQPVYDQNYIANLATDNYQDYQVYPVLNSADYNQVSAFSTAPGALVHAAAAGSIISVKALAYTDCGTGFVSPSNLGPDPATVVYTQFEADQLQPCLVAKFVYPTEGPASNYTDTEYYLDATNVYIVTIQIADNNKIEYLVRNANQYVVDGDTIAAGCVLGETIPLTNLPTPAVNFGQISAVAGTVGVFTGGALSFVAGAVSTVTGLFSAFSPSPTIEASAMGYTALMAFDESDNRIELYSSLTVEPTNTDRCNASGEYKDCLAFNPQFANGGDGWQASGNVEWTEPGVILDPGESVSAQINLSSTGDYTATAYAQTVGGLASEIRISLGSHTQRFPAPVEWSSVQIAAEPLGAPDAGAFYTVTVQNTGTNPIAVASLCVTDGAPNTGPNSCYFNNYTFKTGTSGWDVTEGVTPFDESLNVPDDGVISQNVKLYPLPSGPATYNLLIRANWWYTGELDTGSMAAASAQIQYEWPSGSGYQNMVPISVAGNLATGLGTMAYKAEIEVSSLTDAVMNIKVNTTTVSTLDVQGLTITSACLSTTNGANFPQQGGGGNIPPIDANCEYVGRPQNDNPAAWLQWHWAKSEMFFRCDLMVLLNKMYTLGKQSYTLAGWQARYWESSARLWANWLGAQLFPWFNGHFRNIAIGQVTTVYSSGGSCSDLFCVLDRLITSVFGPLTSALTQVVAVLTGGVSLLFSLITGLIGVGLSFMIRLFTILNDASGLLAGIITAYTTATPATIAGLPVCSIDPTSSPFCRATYVLDNTIFGGRWEVLLTLIIAVATIMLILWAIKEFKTSVVSAAGGG